MGCLSSRSFCQDQYPFRTFGDCIKMVAVSIIISDVGTDKPYGDFQNPGYTFLGQTESGGSLITVFLVGFMSVRHLLIDL